MGIFNGLTKYLDALDMEGLGEWVTEMDSNGRIYRTPYVEYWDVVHRFCDSLDGFCEEHPEYLNKDGGPEGSGIIYAIKNAIEREDRCPGVLLGYLNNGTIAEWLRGLEMIDGGAKKKR